MITFDHLFVYDILCKRVIPFVIRVTLLLGVLLRISAEEHLEYVNNCKVTRRKRHIIRTV